MFNGGNPTLIIGVGGIGCAIAAEIGHSLSDEDKRHVSVIGMDTNVHDLAQLRKRHNMKIIQISNDRPEKFHLEQHPEYREWFPPFIPLFCRNMVLSGSRQFRAMTRLACLAAAEDGRLDMIRDEIERIRKASPGCSSISVAIVGSICGSTGSALAVLLPFYLRGLLEKHFGLDLIEMIGCFIGQGALCNLLPGAITKDLARANAYACMREWNAFYTAAQTASAENRLKLEWYQPRRYGSYAVPFDRIFLLEDLPNPHPESGYPLDYARQVIEQLVLRPTQIMSLEDNMAFPAPDAAVRRFSSAGLAQLVYPQERAVDYVTKAVLAKSVEQEWLCIDRMYEGQLRAAMERHKSDPSVVLPPLYPTWAKLFRDVCFRAHSPLARIAGDAFVTDGGQGEPVPKSSEVVQALEEAVRAVSDSEEFARMAEDCRIDARRMQSMEEANEHIWKVTESIRRLNSYAEYLCKCESARIAKHFTPDYEAALCFQNTPLLQMLYSVHPVAARFLVIDLINRLEELEQQMHGALADIDPEAMLHRDYDPHTEGIQNPLESLRNIEERENPIWRLLGEVGQRISPTAAAMKKLTKKLEEDCSAQVALVRRYVECSVKCNAAHAMLQWLYPLEEGYHMLLQAAAEARADAMEEMQQLERMSPDFWQRGVYCSPEAFLRMTEEYWQRWGAELSEETKVRIFQAVFSACSGPQPYGTRTAEEDAQRAEQRRKKIRSFMRDAVTAGFCADVRHNGRGIVNLNIRRALEKEFELLSGLTEADADYEQQLADYIHRTVQEAFSEAMPMLRTDGNGYAQEIKLMKVSPACAERTISMKPDEALTGRYYLPGRPDIETVIDERTADTEITLLRYGYCCSVEDIAAYRPGSAASDAYFSLTEQFGKDPEDIHTVTPHLDQYWHEEGFLPSLHRAEREAYRRDRLRAFIGGLGYGILRRRTGDDGEPTGWYLTPEGKSIRSCGALIGGRCSDLFRALLFSRDLVQTVCARADAELKRTLPGESALVRGLSGEEDGSGNIFDIFLAMRPETEPSEWKSLFDGLLQTVQETAAACGADARAMLEKLFAPCQAAADRDEAEHAVCQMYQAILRKAGAADDKSETP